MNITSIRDVIEKVKTQNAQMIDLRFVDILGAWHHVTIPATRLDESVWQHGIPFDGSSIPGFKTIEGGDLVLIPDISTLQEDPFFDIKTFSMICYVAEADTLQPFDNDPRTVAQRAEKTLKDLNIADYSLWGPEFEFYIFDKITYQNDINLAQYRIDSEEADWNSGADEGKNLGGTIPRKGGYHAMPPLDKHYELRSWMSLLIEKAGIDVRYHHHEVGGPGQSEIEINLLSLEKAADAVMIIKYITKMAARKYNKTVTYMPKPLYNEAGSGMHFHQMLVKNNKSLFFDPNAADGLSQIAKFYIGGILKHGKALAAITNPSTNSYKRLVPGFEAPVSLCYGIANRSAAIRIPKYVNNEKEKRIEYRPSDGTCNVYLSIAAQLMAGIDGIINKIDPQQLGFGPIEGNIFDMPYEKRKYIQSLPTSLKEALDELEKDHEFLLRNNVFNKGMLESFIKIKMQDYEQVRNRPHPYEMSLYFDL